MTDNRKIGAGKAVVEAFIEQDVKFVFGLAGSHVLTIFDALADAPNIRHVVVKHEGNAAFMAGMVGYLTGQPGVALVTAGPGATNSLSGVAQAYAQSVPMVHISGNVPLGAGNMPFHGVDRADFVHRMFADVTKWSVRIERAKDIPGVLARAFSTAASGRPGPVHVDIPINILQSPSTALATYVPAPVERQCPPEQLVQHTARALAKARRPIICAGRGVLVHHAEAELVALAEALSAPVVYSTDALGVIAEDHPLAVGSFGEFRGNSFAGQLIKESDFLFAIGLRSNTRLTDALLLAAPPDRVFVALDEAHTLNDMGGETHIGAADSQLFLSQLLAHADVFSRPAEPSVQARIARQKDAFQRGLALHLAPFENAKPLHFGHVARELLSQIEPDAIVVAGVGNHAIWGEVACRLRGRESYMIEGSWGTMGSELPGGIAAKLVHPQRQVVVITGDGSFLMSSPDFVTAVEAGANILVVVLNDSRYGMITALQRGEFGRSYGDEIGWIDFARYAESFGATGVRLEAPEEITGAVARSLTLSARGPVILDAVCSHEYSWPNRDAIAALGNDKGVSNE